MVYFFEVDIMYNILLLGLVVIFFLIYLFEVRKVKFNIRLIFLISLFAGISYILSMFKFISMPQGGSVTLFSMLPVMFISIIYGRGVGLTLGILLGFLKILDGVVLLHPIQFILDYILSNMCLGFSNIFGINNKFKVFFGCLFSGFLCVMFNVISGVVFFSEFAPSGMNVWIYSTSYNFSSIGLEVLMTSLLMCFVPIQKFIDNKIRT